MLNLHTNFAWNTAWSWHTKDVCKQKLFSCGDLKFLLIAAPTLARPFFAKIVLTAKFWTSKLKTNLSSRSEKIFETLWAKKKFDRHVCINTSIMMIWSFLMSIRWNLPIWINFLHAEPAPTALPTTNSCLWSTPAPLLCWPVTAGTFIALSHNDGPCHGRWSLFLETDHLTDARPAVCPASCPCDAVAHATRINTWLLTRYY